MHYALLGDIHSSKTDLERVLADITDKAPNAVKVGTGDLFECTISKKNIAEAKFTRLEDVMLIPEGFQELLTFLSVKGNQEERILLITETADPLREKLSAMPTTFEIGNAEIIHGHQWEWGGEPWSPVHLEVEVSTVFYGHSHRSALSKNGKNQIVEFGIPYEIGGEHVLVNVGAVVGDREWVLYDQSANTVTFMKAE
ncbi:metallophosphoesterase family protein [Filibacter tadaridae]|uniref:Calcineurin-like phosphoesterase superfamily domain protein n=1 Tax=Filibacter tadaridae TaxID=2483811 RepID=A0A3P5XCN0_9BACL|nr:metallophosphoesterase family protein [Filibacter tadaridae]VDC29092.1 Calcineurin-like phosphoesterase superfamily domain protein [Filibacter tadaridae]